VDDVLSGRQADGAANAGVGREVERDPGGLELRGGAPVVVQAQLVAVIEAEPAGVDGEDRLGHVGRTTEEGAPGPEDLADPIAHVFGGEERGERVLELPHAAERLFAALGRALGHLAAGVVDLLGRGDLPPRAEDRIVPGLPDAQQVPVGADPHPEVGEVPHVAVFGAAKDLVDVVPFQILGTSPGPGSTGSWAAGCAGRSPGRRSAAPDPPLPGSARP
jgi:hypothetical protein